MAAEKTYIRFERLSNSKPGYASERYVSDKPSVKKAKCEQCHHITNSDSALPFYKYLPKLEHDSYYCGCWGWD